METTVEVKRIYQVTFDDGKVGRSRIDDGRFRVSSLEDLVDRIEAAVRPKLLSNDIGVMLDNETLKGTVTAGVRTVGRFTVWRVEEPEVAVDSSSFARADHVHGGARCEWVLISGGTCGEFRVGLFRSGHVVKPLCEKHSEIALRHGWEAEPKPEPKPKCEWGPIPSCGSPAIEQRIGPLSSKTKWLCPDHLARAKAMRWATPSAEPESATCQWYFTASEGGGQCGKPASSRHSHRSASVADRWYCPEHVEGAAKAGWSITVDEVSTPCGNTCKASPGDTCVLVAGHSGNHRAGPFTEWNDEWGRPERPRCSWDEASPGKQCRNTSIGRYRLWGDERVLCDYHVKVTQNQNRPTLETW